MATSKSSHRPPNKRIGNSQPTNLLRVVSHFSSAIVERAKRERTWKSPHASKGVSPRRVSPFLACGDFHERSRFARSTIPEEKWGTSRSLACYFHHVLIIGAITKYCLGGGGALRLRARDSSNRINSTCTIDVSETNLKCLSDFNYCSTLMTKVATNK